MEIRVDDTFVIKYTEHKEQFLQYTNDIDSLIIFTEEDTMENGSMSFWEILVTPEHNGTLSTSNYRKTTYTY